MTTIYKEVDVTTTAVFDKAKPSELTFRNFEPTIPSNLLVLTLRDRFGDLLLDGGASLSIENAGDYFPDLKQFAWDQDITKVWLRAWRWNFPDNTGARQLDFALWYGFTGTAQWLTLYASSSGATSLGRHVSAAEYAEKGYEGHLFYAAPNFTNEDEQDFVRIYRQAIGFVTL